MSLLKLMSVLLDYPQDALWEHGDELIEVAQAARLPAARKAQLVDFVRDFLATDSLHAQERWLMLFDRGRSMSLLLFEHIHGESRDRGQAMVDLIDAYRKNGYELSAKELPDYLPLLLEYLSLRPETEARDWLQHVSHIIALLAARAEERQSPYSLLLALLVEFANGKSDLTILRQRASEEPRDDTPEVMDQLWEEEAVRFGAEAPSEDCSPPSRLPVRPTSPTAAQQVQP